jgi:hypothetical protein
MEQVLVNESSLQDIANAIREKTEGTEPILPSEMGNVIRTIETGGALKYATGTINPTSGTKIMTANGIGFRPSIVYMHHNATKGAYCFGSTNIAVFYDGGDTYTPQFQPSDDGFTFTATTSFTGNTYPWTWYAYGL